LPRTSHWTGMALDDAGFEVRDCVHHVFGQGWNKSKHHLKPAHEHWILCRKPLSERTIAANVLRHGTGTLNTEATRVKIDGPVDPKRKRYNQPGGGLPDGNKNTSAIYEAGFSGKYNGAAQPHPDSPRHDARGRFPADFLLTHAQGCKRVGVKRVTSCGSPSCSGKVYVRGRDTVYNMQTATTHRNHAEPDGKETVDAWECVDGCPVKLLSSQSGTGRNGGQNATSVKGGGMFIAGQVEFGATDFAGDRGTAARFFKQFEPDPEPFFYCAKAAPRERNNGIAWTQDAWPGDILQSFGHSRSDLKDRRVYADNAHSTVKPLALMRYLVRMITPPGGTVIDPFCGSGTTCVAAWEEGFHFLACDEKPEYVEIARARIRHAREKLGLFAEAE